jgi:hypothetical protein
MLHSRKRRNVKKSKESTFQDKVAKNVAGFLLSIQNRFASFMNGKINKLSIRSKQVCLAIFCLMLGGFSVYAFVGAFRNSTSSGKRIQPDQAAVPKHFDRTDLETKDPSVSERDIMRINSFKKIMDSLSKSPKTRPVYDSILKARPGLMDTIQVIEAIYYSQSK